MRRQDRFAVFARQQLRILRQKTQPVGVDHQREIRLQQFLQNPWIRLAAGARPVGRRRLII